MVLFQIKTYLKFLWKSTNQHGVHSPFVFDLVTKCFYDETRYPQYSILKNYRKSLLQNRNFIDVTDFGAGSKVFKSNKREIAKIAKTAGITATRAELLFRVTQYFKPENVLEIGTSLGLATVAIALGNPAAKVISLEGCGETTQVAKQQFNQFDLQNIVMETGEFENSFSKFNHSTFDVIYFDGNHQKEATLKYFDLLLPTITNDSVWVFDDIHWSPDMEEAWEVIKKNSKIKVTIDTFQWGFVFFRKEMEKENFVIRA